MSNLPLSSLPYLPAAGFSPLLRALFKPAARSSGSALSASYVLDRIDRGHVQRYNTAFGFLADTVPLTYLYLLAQRAQLATMLDCPIPFRIPGLIHVANRLALHAPLDMGASLILTTTLSLPPPSLSGAESCVLATQGFQDDELVFSCDSTYLIKRGQSTQRGTPAPVEGAELGSWTLAPDAGRRYAALSGDWNPIHLWPWSAQLMGMRAPIIHGMHSVAMASALYQNASGEFATSLVCQFKKPIPLGAQLMLFGCEITGKLTVLYDGRPAIECEIQSVKK